MMLFESHAHLDDSQFDADRDRVIRDAYEAGVKAVINVGADMSSSRASIDLSEKYPFICASCGIHPHEASSYGREMEEELMCLLRHPKAVAVGEIGLDYYYGSDQREKQKEVFRKQIQLARQLKKPVIIHNREAHKDCWDILLEEKAHENRGVFHCYSGSGEMARQILKYDYYISFTGVVTFKNARKVLEAVQVVPLERLLLETDSPYLSPEPHRGKRNDPGNLVHIARKIAEIKGVDVERLCEATWDNTLRLFPDFTFGRGYGKI
ncbi:MAG: TatD family hydrolase [Clostridia bacterium]